MHTAPAPGHRWTSAEQADQVSVIILALRQRWQRAAWHGQGGAAQGFGGAAVTDFGEAGDCAALAIVLQLFNGQGLPSLKVR